MKVTMSAAHRAKTSAFIEMSRWVRTGFTVSALVPNDLPASPTALLITPHDFTMPMMPLMAIPPIPM